MLIDVPIEEIEFSSTEIKKLIAVHKIEVCDLLSSALMRPASMDEADAIEWAINNVDLIIKLRKGATS